MSLSITLVLVIITGLISYRAGLTPQQKYAGGGLFDKLKHYPVAESNNKEYYRFLTSGFVHGSWTHLLINMFVLWQFGEIIEMTFVQVFGNMGRLLFLLLYLTAIVIADIPTYLQHRNNPSFASIGASGAVSAIVFAYILFYPLQGLTFIFFPFFSIPAIIMGIGYLIYSSWASKNSRDNIDHSAHFAGAIYGIIFTVIAYPAVISHFMSSVQEGLPF